MTRFRPKPPGVGTAYDDLQLAVALPLQETKIAPQSPLSDPILFHCRHCQRLRRFRQIYLHCRAQLFFSLLPSQTLEGCAVLYINLIPHRLSLSFCIFSPISLQTSASHTSWLPTLKRLAPQLNASPPQLQPSPITPIPTVILDILHKSRKRLFFNLRKFLRREVF